MNNRKLQADFVSIVEAIYAVDQPADEWLNKIMSAVAPAVEVSAGIGGLLYQFGETDGDPIIRLDYIKGIGVPDGWLDVGVRNHANPELQPAILRAYQQLLCGDLRSFLPPEPTLEAVHADYLESKILDAFLINGCDTSGRGASMYIFSRTPLQLSKSRLELLTRLATHLATGYRLQQRLAAMHSSAQVEAVITPRGRVEHVEAAADSDDARASLQDAVEHRHWAQGRARKDEPDKAIAVWRGLVNGRWTLVDRYENDGKRYIVARENTPSNRGPASLSERERHVVALASLGRTNKVIAYELGLAHATVRVLLLRATRKLGARSRTELVEQYQQHIASNASS